MDTWGRGFLGEAGYCAVCLDFIPLGAEALLNAGTVKHIVCPRCEEGKMTRPPHCNDIEEQVQGRVYAADMSGTVVSEWKPEEIWTRL